MTQFDCTLLPALSIYHTKCYLFLISSHPPGARFDPISPFEPRFHPGRGGERFGIGGRGGGRMTYE